MNKNLLLKRILFYVVSFTWGGLMSIIGAIVTLILLPFGKQGIYHGRVYTAIGENWGGLEFGCFFICCNNYSEQLLAHEAGHGLQNCLWGPLFPFVIMIPSAIRYWIFQQRSMKDKQTFATVITTVILLLAAATILLPILTGIMALFSIPVAITFYGCFISYWLFCVELPLHTNGNPDYDDAWFEGQATNWGLEYIATDKI